MSNYGLLTYPEGPKTFNLGDNVQSLAARQFLPRVDHFVHRERLGDFKGEPVKLILNGWFTHNVHEWVPSVAVDPLFVSFHVNNTAAPHMLDAKGVSYLKRHEPIGCRDHFTVETLRAKGVDAYFTGCLTLTLDNYKVSDSERGDDIYIVDPLYSYPSWTVLTENFRGFARGAVEGKLFRLGRKKKHLRKLFDQSVLDSAKWRTQVPPAQEFGDDVKFAMAEKLMHEYARAKLVVTSRIHCALPCLAMGTPVIFLNAFDSFVDSCRFEGILELFNRIDIDARTGEFTANFELGEMIDASTMVKNLGLHHALAEPLKQRCREFIADGA